MVWDAENRLIETVKGGQTVTYTYDYMSRRVAKTVGTTTYTYLYDGWNPIREIKTINAASQITRYAWGLDLSQSLQGAGGVGGLLLVSGPGGVHAPTYDANGNISEYIDLGNGSIAAHFEYDAFGREIVSPVSAPAPFGFSTKYTDKETKLVYYGYRSYNPELGRWINRDPIEEEGGLNLYGFVYNNTYYYFDDLGGEVLTIMGGVAVYKVVTVVVGVYIAWEVSRQLASNPPYFPNPLPRTRPGSEAITRAEVVESAIPIPRMDVKKRKGFWFCQARCNVHPTPYVNADGAKCPAPHPSACPAITEGSGIGKNRRQADNNAKRNAQIAITGHLGCRTRHCHSYSCVKL